MPKIAAEKHLITIVLPVVSEMFVYSLGQRNREMIIVVALQGF
jgi:hypothetical protein